MHRAVFLSGTGAFVAALGLPKNPFADLEARHGGRLGVVAVNTGNGAHLAHRPNERFPMCSTFKVLLAGAVLSRVDAGAEHLDRHVSYAKLDLLDYAPIAKAHVSAGFMTVRALCEAAIEYSDNTAANLLLSAIGGPERVTMYARSLGDSRTRLDRNEPSLNSAIPGDERDTTTPAAMVADVQKMLTGGVLSAASNRELEGWLMRCTTGVDAIRAGIPANWRAGDKTGSGAHATTNDVAVLYPPGRPPIFVAAYYTGSSASRDARYGVLAEVGRIVSSAWGGEAAHA
jgi:beta-lactamase class A